ncbi:MAG: DUF3187 family protein [Stagnimonas sp.]|nr:DUF3187 family protein [Stagnimonas sp.]
MRLRLCFALAAFAVATTAQAQGFETFNQSSVARASALPGLGQGAVVPKGESINSVTLDWSNEFFVQGNAREDLTLDGESQRVALRYRAGIAPVFGHALEWSLEVPLLFTGGGVMDSGIESWHDTFGLPNANRGDVPQDRYRLRYVRDGVTLLDINKGDSGFADVRLGLGLALSERFTLRGLLQLPTGDKDQLTGGHTGGALWVDYSLPLTESRRAALLLSGGVSAATTDGPLADLQQPVVGLAGAVLIVPIYGALDGVVQVNAHSKLYKSSSLDPLSRVGAPLAFGLRLPYQHFVFDLAVLEDPSVNASPDFGILFGIKVKAY